MNSQAPGRPQHANPEMLPRGRAASKHRRYALWSVVVILVAAFALPLTGYLVSHIDSAYAQTADNDSNPRSNFWRAVRGGDEGYSAVTGKSMDGTVINDSPGVLIQNWGQNWRQFRNGPLTTYGSWFLAGSLGLIVLYFLIHGRAKLVHGASGVMIKRWNGFERFVHAVTAILFIALAITGLSLLFGRAFLIPWLGASGFAAWAAIAKTIHNFGGLVFSVGVALMFLMWVWHNFPTGVDFKWLFSGGGIIGKAHPSAGRMNAGEKIWFWFIMIVGGAVIASGFVLDFPTLMAAYIEPLARMDPRTSMQMAHAIHATLAIAWTGLFLGHAYIATIGTEGALSGMSNGYVDVNWAKQHHDLWYEKVKDKAPTRVAFGAPAAAAAVAAAGQAAGSVPEDSVLRRHHMAQTSGGVLK